MVYGTAIAILVGAWFTQDEFPVVPILGASAFLTLILAMALHHLAVVDEGDRLAVRFSPLPLFRWTISYADIEKVEVGRTLILDGWGIHYSSQGSWVWNIWGRDCVVVHLRSCVLRIGTDDASNLARFLEGKIGAKRK